MSLPNPYSPGGRPEYLAGRGTERELIRERLSRAALLGRSGGPLLAFYAPRGVGKTSLLRAAQQEADDSGFLTVWVTGRDDLPMLPDLVAALAQSVRARSLGDRAKHLLQLLDKVQVEVGIPGFKVAGEVAATPRTATIERVLEDAGRFVAGHDLKGVAVFVDELHDALTADRKSLLIALQHFDGDSSGCPVVVVGAGLPSLPAAVTEAATFGERTRFVELGRLTDVAVAEALVMPAEHLGVTWTGAAIEAGIELAAGYPHKVQLVGAATWSYARPTRDGEITEGMVHGAAEDIERQMAELFRTRLARVSPEQRRILETMAALGGDATDRAAIAEHLAVESAALSRPRSELIDKGLIEPAGRGKLAFTVPGFGDYVRQALDDTFGSGD